eukprot:15239336-Ditylum_brightwellii.AAC.1
MVMMMVLAMVLTRSEGNEHVVCNKDDDVDDDVDDGVGNSVEDGDDDSVEDGVVISVEDGDDDSVEDGVDGADKHLTHLSQGVYCHFTQRSERNELVVCNKDNDVDDGVDNGVVNSAEDGDDDSVEGADKHLTHLSQGVD